LNNAVVHKYLSLPRIKGYIWAVFRTLLLVGLIFMIIYPLLISVSNAFKTYSDMLDPTVQYLPTAPTFNNFKQAWNYLNYPFTLLCTIGYSIMIALLQTLSCTLIAYGLARFRFWGNKLIFAIIMLTLVIPPQIMLIPIYLRFRFFNIFELFKFSGIFTGLMLVNTPIPVVLLSITGLAFKSGLYIYLLRQFFVNIPEVLEEAASIDGCSIKGTFFKIMLPNALPMVVTVFLFSFVLQWNDYYYSTMLNPNIQTLGMEIMRFKSFLTAQKATWLMATTQAPLFFMLILPLILLYLFTQRFFVESVSKSGIVG
jgi:multiple sugar transport system permease protein